MLACQNGSLDIVDYLIGHGTRVEARDNCKRTPLIHACQYGQSHIVSYLLRRGAVLQFVLNHIEWLVKKNL